MRKALYIIAMVALVGFTATSCKKEKTCACVYERTYADDENIYTFNIEVKIDRGSCEDITYFGLSDLPGEYFQTSCTKKEE